MNTPDVVQRWNSRRSSFRPAGELINTSAYEVAALDSDSTARLDRRNAPDMNRRMNPTASETRVYPSRAAANRAYSQHRATLIAELGWTPEGNTAGDKYLASNVELTRWINEQRAADKRDLLPQISFTVTFNMTKVKALTVHRWDATGAYIP